MRKKWGWRLLYAIVVLFLLCSAAEITVRIQGHRAWDPGSSHLVREGGGPIFIGDADLGYKNLPGVITCTLNDKITFTATNDIEGHRICPTANKKGAPSLWFFGCSFTHGFGVHDEENFVWKTGIRFPGLQITNFGVDGYGPHQSLLQLKRELSKGRKPDMVVLCYGGFHNQRVTCSPFWQKAISGQEDLVHWQYPYRRETGEGLAVLDYSPRVPGTRVSAFMNMIDNRYCAKAEEELHSAAVTEAVIRGMGKLCAENDIRFSMAGIWDHPDTDSMIMRLASTFPSCKVSADPLNTLLSEDLHPSAYGHEQIAAKLEFFFVESGFVPDSLRQ